MVILENSRELLGKTQSLSVACVGSRFSYSQKRDDILITLPQFIFQGDFFLRTWDEQLYIVLQLFSRTLAVKFFKN